jgi:leucyl-tRNA synthetase
MFLYDLALVPRPEPFKKLINQGMIQGQSKFVYRVVNTNTFVSYNLRKQYNTQALHVDVNIVNNDTLDTQAFRTWLPDYHDAEFILEDGKYICGTAVEKMSKSMFNVVNPDMIVEKYGADTLRMYEMFLGPLEMSKPWDTQGIDGVHKFLRRFWKLFVDRDTLVVTDNVPSTDELKVLHKTIKKISSDIEQFSFNTSVSAFMICVNELQTLKCNKRLVLEPLVVLLAPFAPHIAEELWQLLGHHSTVCDAPWPAFDETYLVENVVKYPVSFNGKVRYNIEVAADTNPADVEARALADEQAAKFLEGKTPKKIIVVPGKIVNIVV